MATMLPMRLSLPVLLLLVAGLPAVEIHLTFTAQPPEVVAVWDAAARGRLPEPVTIRQVERTFLPGTAIAAPGTVLTITNEDIQPHNAFALDPRLSQDVDLGMGAPGSTLTRTVDWPTGEVLRHGCKIHPDMRLWILCTDSPRAVMARLARADRQATLTIEGPATPFRVWGDRIETTTLIPGQSVTLLRGGRAIGTATLGSPAP